MPKEIDRSPKKKLPKVAFGVGSAVMAAAAVFSACDCDKEEKGAGPVSFTPTTPLAGEQVKTLTPTQTPEIIQTPEVKPQVSSLPEKVADAIQNKHHIWEKEDLLFSETPRDQVITSTFTFVKRPPFYKGSDQLQIKVYRTIPSISVEPSEIVESVVISDKPAEIANYYVYEHPYKVSGAQTYDKDGNLLAEAYLEYPSPEQRNTAEAKLYLYEIHYDKDGNIQFRAKSELDSVGIKMKEIETEGEKEEEYYFAIPLYSP